jgi:hypothetical protein
MNKRATKLKSAPEDSIHKFPTVSSMSSDSIVKGIIFSFYYLWLVDSADSQNMTDCDKPVVMWPKVSVKTIMTQNHIK